MKRGKKNQFAYAVFSIIIVANFLFLFAAISYDRRVSDTHELTSSRP